MSVQSSGSPETHEQPAAIVDGTERRVTVRPGRTRELVTIGVRALVQLVVVVVVSAGLVAGGLFVAPTIGVSATAVETPTRRPPVIPPSVPPGAREDWAVWTYVEKINQVWGRDWPLVIQWFEELDARYPGNPMVVDKLYVSYLEDGRNRQL